MAVALASGACFTETPATVEDAGKKPPNDVPTDDRPAPADVPPMLDGGADAAPDAAAPTDSPATDIARPLRARTSPTEGGAVAVSSDDAVVVAANRIAGSVAVFSVSWGADGPTPMRRALLPFRDGEPWAAVVGNDDDTAFVVLRRAQELVEVTGLRSTPQVGRRVRVGSEPTGLAISPTGRTLYVANMGDGTLAEVSAASMTVSRVIDLNAALAARLGPHSAARPGTAHPRAVAVTNDGDASDGDETVFVTEFFGQPRRNGVPEGAVGIDIAREGVVYRVAAGSGVVGEAVALGPLEDTGFVDSEALATGCFPSQLHAATVRGTRLYVPAVCASPRGPVGPTTDLRADANFRTQIHSVLYAVDVGAGAEALRERALLTKELNDFYTRTMTAEEARRMPLIPVSVAFAPTGSTALVAAYGADAVYRLRYRGDGALEEVATEGAAAYVDLRATDGNGGALPVGVAWANRGGFAFALGAGSRLLSVVNVNGMNVPRTTPAADPPGDGVEASVARGRRLFATGLGRWSLRGQAWNSCEACHPDGLSDGVTWFFPRGPRQTPSLDGTYDATGAQRVLNWTATLDEVHDFELNVRGNSGGIGAIVHREGDGSTPPRISASDRIIFDGTAPTPPQVATATSNAGLDGSTRQLMPEFLASVRSAIDDWKVIDAYVRSVRAPRAPTNLDAADVAAGRALFEAGGCYGCHGGAGWTVSRRWYVPSAMTNDPMTGTLRTTQYTLPMGFPQGLNPPANNPQRQAFLRLTGDPAILAQNDQLNCVLRNVGTFPTSINDARTGVAPDGVLVREVRADMRAVAQGLSGYNPPSLVGAAFGAPYFHAGNARTLEEVFAPTFTAHAQALASGFLGDASARATQVRQLVAFLLSLDDGAMPVTPATPPPFETDLCPRM